MGASPFTPARLPPGVWRADQLGQGGIVTLPSGFPELDAQLPGGGWPRGMLTELIGQEVGIGELRLLVPVLRALSHERKALILLAPPHVPYAPALTAFGIDLDPMIIVQPAGAGDRLWAIEQTLRSASFGALLAWLPERELRPDHLRRMQLAAQATRAPVFLFRPWPARLVTSPSPLRLLLSPGHGQVLSVQLLKRRGPQHETALTITLPHPPTVLRPGRATSPLSALGQAAAGDRPDPKAPRPDGPERVASGTVPVTSSPDPSAPATRARI
jgi:protein ImuA